MRLQIFIEIVLIISHIWSPSHCMRWKDNFVPFLSISERKLIIFRKSATWNALKVKPIPWLFWVEITSIPFGKQHVLMLILGWGLHSHGVLLVGVICPLSGHFKLHSLKIHQRHQKNEMKWTVTKLYIHFELIFEIEIPTESVWFKWLEIA